MTVLLAERCDPYGIESTVKLMGGMYPQSYMGKNIWYCPQRAVSRHRLICTGGDYGHRLANDGGLIRAFHCDGGHEGVKMPLCAAHIRELAIGPPAPGWSKDMRTPHGQVGGTKANEMCPACMWPPEARELQVKADAMQEELSRLHIGAQISGILGLNLRRIAQVSAAQDQVRARLDELFASGRVHKCPLKLVEVS